MSKKRELINVFMEFKERYNNIQSRVLQINSSLEYTETGKQQAVDQVVNGFTATATSYHDKAVEIIDKGLELLLEQWKESSAGKLLDSNYQAGLANVVKMLEVGAIREEDDIKNIIDTYADDYNALALIRTMLQKSKDEQIQEFTVLIPADNREENKKLLSQLRGNVDTYINADNVKATSKSWNAFNQGTTSVSASMDSMAEFVENRLDDNLKLL
ncbi:hypothetical protein [Waltera sp.]|uniref:hypothetical protein n=1 Tax=Waltera sp. TaxID=2815806 RepID=UPI003AB9A7DB